MSFKRLADAPRPTRPDVDSKDLFINHTLNNRDSDRIFFFASADFANATNRINQGFIVRPDGSRLTLMKQHIGGHPEWDIGHRMIGSVNNRQVIYDTDQETVVGTLGNTEVFPTAEGDFV